MNSEYRDLIAQEFENCVDRTIQRITSSEKGNRPFHSALLSEEVLFWSAFERSFSTSFGQRVIEEIAKLVALSNGARDAERQVETYIEIDSSYEDAIQYHMRLLRDGANFDYSWDSTLQSILATHKSGKTSSRRVISDLWWEKDGINNYISLKTVMPNIDQTAVAKEDCLRLSINDRKCNAFFGLPYNPYGEDRSSYGFNPPKRIFDFEKDQVVLIGKELWDTLGGEGCYEELISIAASVGKETKQKIQRLSIK